MIRHRLVRVELTIDSLQCSNNLDRPAWDLFRLRPLFEVGLLTWQLHFGLNHPLLRISTYTTQP